MCSRWFCQKHWCFCKFQVAGKCNNTLYLRVLCHVSAKQSNTGTPAEAAMPEDDFHVSANVEGQSVSVTKSTEESPKEVKDSAEPEETNMEMGQDNSPYEMPSWDTSSTSVTLSSNSTPEEPKDTDCFVVEPKKETVKKKKDEMAKTLRYLRKLL